MRLPDYLREELDRAGLPWELEDRKKHAVLRVAGRLACTLSYGTCRNAPTREKHNTLSSLRRAIRAAQEEN